jgi:hypothetical protein
MIPYNKKTDNTENIVFRCLQKAMPFAFLLLFLDPGLFVTSEAAAQQVLRPPSNSQDETGETKSDFLFQKPSGFLSFRVGGFLPRTDSEIFNMITRELTLQKSDFRAWDVGVEAGFSLYEKVDLVFSLDDSKRSRNSEFRDFVDEQGLPITQTTTYSQTQLTAGVKYSFVPHGHEVGHYAWLPSPVVPFVSAGAGFLSYSFQQSGDFVDVTNLEIFSATLESSGTAPVIYLGGGADIYLYQSAYLTLDLRYSWARHEMEGAFVGFDPINLSGLRLTAGVLWRF